MKCPPVTTLITLIAMAALLSTGCSMCCGPYDYFYPTYGGKHERVDPEYGRVGSILSDPMANYGGPSADSNLDDYSEDELDEDRDRINRDREEIEPMDRERQPNDDRDSELPEINFPEL